MEKKQNNGAARGGNIAVLVACLAIILLPLVGWFIAGPLLLAAFICSIVAIAQNAARQGIVLMFGSILMPIIAQVVGVAMWAGIGAAGSNEAKKQQQPPQAVSTAYNTVQTQPAQSSSQSQAAPVDLSKATRAQVMNYAREEAKQWWAAHRGEDFTSFEFHSYVSGCMIKHNLGGTDYEAAYENTWREVLTQLKMDGE